MAPRTLAAVAFGLCAIAGAGAQGHEWHRRFSAEFVAATSVRQSGYAIPYQNPAQFFAGYGVETGAERDVRRGLTAGMSLLAAAGMAPGACESDLVNYDTCDDPRGRSIGAFAVLRQYVPRSIAGAHLVATAGVGVYDFSGSYLGRHLKTFGPAIQYGAEAESGKLWRVSFVVTGRGQLIVDPGNSPLQVNSLILGFRGR